MGLRQSGLLQKKTDDFKLGFLHRRLRHPIYTGILLILWCAPSMSQGRLLLATAMTVYIRIGIHFEERDLIRRFGSAYVAYRAQVNNIFTLRAPQHRRG